MRIPLSIDRHEGEEGGRDVLLFPVSRSSIQTFTPTSIEVLNARFTLARRADELADLDRVNKLHLIDGGGDHGVAGVTHGGDCSGQIDQVHDFAAEEVAERVGIVGQGEFRVVRDRFADEFSGHPAGLFLAAA